MVPLVLTHSHIFSVWFPKDPSEDLKALEDLAESGLQAREFCQVWVGWSSCSDSIAAWKSKDTVQPPNGWQITPKQPLGRHSTDRLPAIKGSWVRRGLFGAWCLHSASGILPHMPARSCPNPRESLREKT